MTSFCYLGRAAAVFLLAGSIQAAPQAKGPKGAKAAPTGPAAPAVVKRPLAHRDYDAWRSIATREMTYAGFPSRTSPPFVADRDTAAARHDVVQLVLGMRGLGVTRPGLQDVQAGRQIRDRQELAIQGSRLRPCGIDRPRLPILVDHRGI